MEDTTEYSPEFRHRLRLRRSVAKAYLEEDRGQTERIRDAMDILGLTQQDVAEMIGLSRQKVNVALNSRLILDRIEYKLKNLPDEKFPGT